MNRTLTPVNMAAILRWLLACLVVLTFGGLFLAYTATVMFSASMITPGNSEQTILSTQGQTLLQSIVYSCLGRHWSTAIRLPSGRRKQFLAISTVKPMWPFSSASTATTMDRARSSRRLLQSRWDFKGITTDIRRAVVTRANAQAEICARQKVRNMWSLHDTEE